MAKIAYRKEQQLKVTIQTLIPQHFLPYTSPEHSSNLTRHSFIEVRAQNVTETRGFLMYQTVNF
jgi:hypothetical protein